MISRPLSSKKGASRSHAFTLKLNLLWLLREDAEAIRTVEGISKNVPFLFNQTLVHLLRKFGLFYPIKLVQTEEESFDAHKNKYFFLNLK